ncbi:IucA/IucC family protein [Novosphingobium sp. Rr 2-17]|nr:IucA/IucC family protein [Novosphingobium sp. Rr 2-17]
MDKGAALTAVADQMGAARDRAILSLHPVQAKLLLRDPRVRDQIESGRIRDLGATGKFARALASVRTLLVESSDHLLKTSLAIRIANCVRKNAWYELESAVVIDRVITRVLAKDPDGCGGLSVIPEPASLGWSPVDASPVDELWFR